MRRRAVVMAVVLVSALAWGGEPAPQLLPGGTAAPALTLERVSGGTLTLADLRGQVVLVDFWATWCPPCRAELPWLVKLAKRYQGQRVWLVAVNQDEAPEQRELVEALAAKIPGLAAWAVYGNEAVKRSWQVDGLPTLYLIDRQGHVIGGHEGRLTEEAVTRAVEQALRQP